MNPRSVSISGMMGLVLVVAMAFAAPTVIITNVASAIVLFLLLTALAGLIYLRGLERVFWGGFALFGWITLLLINGSWITGQFGPDLTSGLRDLVEIVIPKPAPVISRPATGPTRMLVPARVSVNSSNLLADRSVKVGNLVQIARLLMVLVFAQLGGSIARGFAIRTEKAVRESEERSAPRTNP